MRIKSLLFLLLLVGLSPSLALANSITFATGSFTPSEWSSSIFSGSTGTASAATVSSGGNPGAYRQLTLTVAPFQFVLDAQLWSSAVFTPAAQGAVNSVSLSYDITRISSTNVGATQIAKGIAVMQNGVVYTSLLGVSIAAAPNWDHVSVSNIIPLFPQVNWKNGSQITLGFYDSVGTSQVPFTIVGGYDNYSTTVTYTPIPEPATLSLFGTGIIACITRLRRKAKAGLSA